MYDKIHYKLKKINKLELQNEKKKKKKKPDSDFQQSSPKITVLELTDQAYSKPSIR